MGSYKFISLRDSLKGAVTDLLQDEKMACLKTQDGLVEIISALSYYTEEGHVLFPEVYIFDDLNAVLKTLPTCQHVCINSGPKDVSTLIKSLKQCAPLAQRGWAIYILRTRDSFEYGVFRTGTTVLSVSIEDILINNGDPSIPAIMVHQIADKMVEIKGILKSRLSVNFGVTRGDAESPLDALEKFILILTSDVPKDIREYGLTYYRRLLSETLKEGHGVLATIVHHKKRTIPKRLRDGIILNPPINVIEKINELRVNDSTQSNSQLDGCRALISGMMLSDGITIFGSDASVRAYNVFVKHPMKERKEKAVGGARSRTFEVLCVMLGKELIGVLTQSQDGKVQYKGVAPWKTR